jgi:hypothetical protein
MVLDRLLNKSAVECLPMSVIARRLVSYAAALAAVALFPIALPTP